MDVRTADLIEGLYGYREGSTGPVVRKELASGASALIIGLGEPVDVADPRVTSTQGHTRWSGYHALATGPWDSYALSRVPPGWSGVQVNLTPEGARRVVGVPMAELANRSVDLTDLWGSEGARLVDALMHERVWPRRFEIVRRFLLQRSQGSPAQPPAVGWVYRQILHRPEVPIQAWALEVGWSRKHLASRFRESVGLTPKRVARLTRFRRAVAELRAKGAPPSWTAFALRQGFYDQPHMNREFRALAGGPPSTLVGPAEG